MGSWKPSIIAALGVLCVGVLNNPRHLAAAEKVAPPRPEVTAAARGALDAILTLDSPTAYKDRFDKAGMRPMVDSVELVTREFLKTPDTTHARLAHAALLRFEFFIKDHEAPQVVSGSLRMDTVYHMETAMTKIRAAFGLDLDDATSSGNMWRELDAFLASHGAGPHTQPAAHADAAPRNSGAHTRPASAEAARVATSAYEALIQLNMPRTEDPMGRQAFIRRHPGLRNAIEGAAAPPPAAHGQPPASQPATTAGAIRLASVLAAAPTRQNAFPLLRALAEARDATDDSTVGREIKSRLQAIIDQLSAVPQLRDPAPAAAAPSGDPNQVHAGGNDKTDDAGPRHQAPKLTPVDHVEFSGTYVYTRDANGNRIAMPDGDYLYMGRPLIVRGGKHMIMSN